MTWLKRAIRVCECGLEKTVGVLSSQFTNVTQELLTFTHPRVCRCHVCWHASIEVAADGMNHTAILPYHPHAL